MDNAYSLDYMVREQLNRDNPKSNIENLQRQIDYFANSVKALADSVSDSLSQANKATLSLMQSHTEQIQSIMEDVCLQVQGLTEYTNGQANQIDRLEKVLESFISIMLVEPSDANIEAWQHHKSVVLKFLEAPQKELN